MRATGEGCRYGPVHQCGAARGLCNTGPGPAAPAATATHARHGRPPPPYSHIPCRTPQSEVLVALGNVVMSVDAEEGLACLQIAVKLREDEVGVG